MFALHSSYFGVSRKDDTVVLQKRNSWTIWLREEFATCIKYMRDFNTAWKR